MDLSNPVFGIIHPDGFVVLEVTLISSFWFAILLESKCTVQSYDIPLVIDALLTLPLLVVNHPKEQVFVSLIMMHRTIDLFIIYLMKVLLFSESQTILLSEFN